MALVGPTASGKSALAMALARRLPGPPVEIVSADAMQVYRGMDVGTAKPSSADRAEVPHHLLDLVEPHEEFSVARFQAEARRALAAIEDRGHRALVVGGTGLYVRAVVDGLDLPGQWSEVRADLETEKDTHTLHGRLRQLDPVAAGRMEPSNRRRVLRALEVTLGSGRPFSSFGPGLAAHPETRYRMAGVWLPRAMVGRRIEQRFEYMLGAGLTGEVQSLWIRPGGLSRTASQAVGYREVLDHLAGRCSLDEAVAEAVGRTRVLARRQRVWFRRDPRITWYGSHEDPGTVLAALLGDWS
ncbi:MAG: tRNA (adenosine(37)-N6)-dimethylallyltransferase MiaA [Actinomycetota bacterium]|nr:tRNA (adenosine(37)-N6)-dimethylallyltransferase MiaA [Actinomycetota bacterium]MDQ3574364.1 tRNA (adenosine(37)-N6)-dimethylallyltransferase MiaA [Actinomycetota bacterium]